MAALPGNKLFWPLLPGLSVLCFYFIPVFTPGPAQVWCRPALQAMGDHSSSLHQTAWCCEVVNLDLGLSCEVENNYNPFSLYVMGDFLEVENKFETAQVRWVDK